MTAATRPYRAPTSPRAPDPAAVLRYLESHSTHEAARRFGIAERSVRRIRQRQIERENRQISPNCPNTDNSRISPMGEMHSLARRARVYPATADDVAGASTWWKCPATGELMPVIPGTRRHQWERERRAAHARHLAAVYQFDKLGEETYQIDKFEAALEIPESDYVTPADPPPVTPNSAEQTDRTADTPPSAPPRPESPRTVHAAPPAPLRSVVIMRPAPPPAGGLLDWLRSCPMIGPVPLWSLLVLGVMVALTWLG